MSRDSSHAPRAAEAASSSTSRFYSLWRRIHRIWISLGLSVLIIFTVWSLVAYRASGAARDASRTDAQVLVQHDSGVWRFTSRAATRDSGAAFVFFPGALVDPRAYAPIARAVARAGFPAFIIELPRRGAFGGTRDPQLRLRVHRVLLTAQATNGWVAAGHSRGAVVVSSLASESPAGLTGLVLIGTSHPRDVDLSSLSLPVTKIVGTRDGLASRPEVEQNRARLPASTNWVWIEGGNHSQFGWYGFQPGDRLASIAAADQRTLMIKAILETLRAASATRQPARQQ